MTHKGNDSAAQPSAPQEVAKTFTSDANKDSSKAFSSEALSMGTWRLPDNGSDKSANPYLTKVEFKDEPAEGQVKPAEPKQGEVPKPADKAERPAEQQAGTDAKTANPRADINGVRERLRQAGIDPDKSSIKVGVWEPDMDIRPGQGDFHAGTVRCSIADPELGLNRNNDAVKLFQDQAHDVKLEDYKDKPDGLQRYMAEHGTAIMNSFSDFLQKKVLDGGDPSLRVLSASVGTTPVDAAMNTLFQFQQEPDKYSGMIKQLLGEEKGNKFIEEQKKRLAERGPIVLGGDEKRDWNSCPDLRGTTEEPRPQPEDPTALESEAAKKLIDLYQQTLDTDPGYKQAQERYLQTAKEVADKGVIIVLAAANNGDVAKDFGITYENRSGYNLFAQSDHVLAIGGYDAGSAEPKMFDGSSAGTERYPITTLGPGENVPTRLVPPGKIAGTSYAAPLTGATIGLMLEQNPNLKLDDVKRILATSSDRIPGVAPVLQGAGMLRMDAAIIAARDSRRRG